MDGWLLLRLACIVACAVCGILLSSARFRQWPEWTQKTRDHWWALAGWTFFGAYGSIESIVQGNPGGSRIIVLTLICALTLRALLRSGELRARPALEKKKDSHEL